MSKFSTTINLFIPLTIINRIREIKVNDEISFDWRYPNLCHITVKAISFSNELPDDEKLLTWTKITEKILNNQMSFSIEVKDIASFPRTVYARVFSESLYLLHKRLFEVLPSSQPEFENLNYVPHASVVTLKNSTTSQVQSKNEFGIFIAKEMELVTWNLENLSQPIIHHKFSLK